jgi:acyl carrier protein
LGLELVEMVMDAEETFGIAIPDSQISEVRTVGEFHECIVEILKQDLDETTLATNILDDLRNAITSVTGAAPGSIDADTRLSTLFPFIGRKTAWKRLEQSFGVSLPPLELPRLIRTIGIVVAIPLGWICGLLAMQNLGLPKAGFLAALAAILGIVLGVISIVIFWQVGRWLLSPLAACWPRGLDTVGILSRAVLQMHYGCIVKRERTFNRDEVWSILKEIIAGTLGIDQERITPESRFAEDLGAG